MSISIVVIYHSLAFKHIYIYVFIFGYPADKGWVNRNCPTIIYISTYLQWLVTVYESLEEKEDVHRCALEACMEVPRPCNVRLCKTKSVGGPPIA